MRIDKHLRQVMEIYIFLNWGHIFKWRPHSTLLGLPLFSAGNVCGE